MVYSSRCVMAVIVDGKPVQESHDGTVAIPFGTQYALRFKNKHDRRAVVKFTIDNEDASGPGYVIEPGKSITIERFSNEAVQFKFVDLENPEAVAEGKNGPNDGTKGVIEARFYLEKKVEYPKRLRPIRKRDNPYKDYPWAKPWAPTPWVQPFIGGNPDITVTYNAKHDGHELHCVPQNANLERTPLSDGCTVPGSASEQTFETTHIEYEKDFTSLKIVLKGYVQTEVPKTKHCTSCGAKKARKSDRFCGQCGSKL